MKHETIRRGLFASMIFLTIGGAIAQGAQQAPKKPAKSSAKKAAPPAKLVIEEKATDVLKAASSRLAAAKSMTFTAVVSYEQPSLIGPPIVYTTKSEVTMERPDKLRVITPGDGPASEFYYDGKIMTAYEPAANLVAIADAPPTIDAALKAAHDSAAIYFPFSDLIVADPYKDIAGGLKFAFYIGQSKVIGGTTTDMVAYGNDDIFVEAWIGTEDKLPRMLRAIYSADPSRLRHQLEISDWQLDVAVPDDAFTSAKAASAQRIKFARPDPQVPPPAAKGKPSTK